MAWIPDRRTLLKFFTATALLGVACGGVFFVFWPYEASQLRAELADRYYASGEAPLVLATAEEDGVFFHLGTVLQQRLDVLHTYTIDVKATSGSLENLSLLNEGAADLALVQSGTPTEGDDLVALANLGRQYLHLVVPADSSVEEFRDLAGKRIGVGPAGGGAEALAERVITFFHFGEETALVRDHNPDLKEAFLDGEIDAAFTVHGLFDPGLESLLAAGWYRLIPLNEAEAVSRYLPGVFREVFPANLYGPDRSIPPSGDVPFQTLAVNTLLVSEGSLPNRQVHALLEQIFRGDFLKAAHLSGLTERTAQSDLHLPLHPAAETYYNRRAPISSDRVEIIFFFLAGVVGLASVVYFLLARNHRRSQVEKRASIRPYFEAMMDFGDEMEGATNPTSLTRLIHKMMATQRGAERKWLEGKFDAEDMENLFAVYGLRCDNAYHKIFDLHLQALRGMNTVEPARPGSHTDTPDYIKPVAPESRPTFESRPYLDRHPAPEPEPEREPHPYVKKRTYTETRYEPIIESDEDDNFFSGSALAGIDSTKSEIAQRLPGRYDPGLLYDTEASGAGSVRVRKSKPQADLQAVVEKDVPARIQTVPEPDETPEEAPFPEAFIPDDVEPEEDNGPDQLMLF